MISYTRPYDDVEAPGLQDWRPRIWGSGADPRRQRAFWRAIGCLLLFFFGFGVGRVTAASESCVTLAVRPLILLEPGDLRVEARVRRHADHRSYVLTWTSDVGSEGWQVRQLEAEDSSLLQTQVLRDQVPANYTFTAAIYGAGGKLLGRDQAEIHTPEAAPRRIVWRIQWRP